MRFVSASMRSSISVLFVILAIGVLPTSGIAQGGKLENSTIKLDNGTQMLMDLEKALNDALPQPLPLSADSLKTLHELVTKQKLAIHIDGNKRATLEEFLALPKESIRFAGFNSYQSLEAAYNYLKELPAEKKTPSEQPKHPKETYGEGVVNGLLYVATKGKKTP